MHLRDAITARKTLDIIDLPPLSEFSRLSARYKCVPLSSCWHSLAPPHTCALACGPGGGLNTAVEVRRATVDEWGSGYTL